MKALCPFCEKEHNNLEVQTRCKMSDIDKPVEDLCDYVLKLRTENAALRERLNNTIELPCGLGDTIYTVIKNCAYCKHYNMGWAECRAPATANFDCESTHRICFTQDIVTDECKKHLCVAELKFDLRFLNPKTGKLEPQYFVDRESAEARLREIQGEER